MTLLTSAHRLPTIVVGLLFASGGCSSSHGQLESDPDSDPDPRGAGSQAQPSAGSGGSSVGSGGSNVGSGGSNVGSGGSGDEIPACSEDRVATTRPASRPVSVRIVAVDFVTLEVPPDLVGKACSALDPQCVNPLVRGVVPESDGFLTFAGLPAGFDGHFELRAPNIMDTLVFSNRPLRNDTTWISVVLLTPGTAQAIAAGAGEMWSGGLVMVDVRNCAGTAAAGVVLEREGAAEKEVAYFVGSYPDRQQDDTVLTRDLNPAGAETALAAFSNLDPGEATIVAFENEHVFGKASVIVRDSTLTYLFLYEGN